MAGPTTTPGAHTASGSRRGIDQQRVSGGRAWTDEIVARLLGGQALTAAVVGAPGSGRSALLAAIAARVRDRNIPLHIGFPPEITKNSVSQHDRPLVLIADDVHLWPSDRLEEIVELVDGGVLALVAATEPRDCEPGVLQVISRARRAQSILTLGPLDTAGVMALAERADVAVTAPMAARIRRSCAGSRRCVESALAAIRDARLQNEPIRDVMTIVDGVAKDRHHRLLRSLDPMTRGVLVLAMLQAPLDSAAVATMLDVDVESAAGAVDRARGTGLIGGSDVFVAAAALPLRDLVGAACVADLRTRVALERLRGSELTADDALIAVDAGFTDPRLLTTLLDESSKFEVTEPVRAAKMLIAADRLAPGRTDIEMRMAFLALDAGDIDGVAATADRRLEEAVEAATELDTVEAGRMVAPWASLAATVAVMRARRSQAANLFRWLAETRGVSGVCDHSDLDHHIAAVLTMIGDGDIASAEAIAATAAQSPPTAARAARVQVIDGLVASVREPTDAEPMGATLDAVMSGLPMALSIHRVRRDLVRAVTSLALHCGEPRAARTMIDLASSNRLIDTLVADAMLGMLAGEPDSPVVRRALEAGPELSLALGPIGRFWIHATRLGVARRAGDTGALGNAWIDAVPTIPTIEVDLFTTLPMIEFWLAAAQLDDLTAVARPVAATDRLLRRIGSPLWLSPWEFAGVQAAVDTDDPAALADRLARVTSFAGYGGPMADRACAATGWAQLLAPTPDAGLVTDGVSALRRLGMNVDAARLAGLAATRTDDASATSVLLQAARAVTDDRPAAASSGPLTEREAEVARELVSGFTYREIGERLFISAKTVEHHVARIRRRLDVRTRSELLSALRAAGYG